MSNTARYIIGTLVIIVIIVLIIFVFHKGNSSAPQAQTFDAPNGTYSFMGDTFTLSGGEVTFQGHSGLEGAPTDILIPMAYTLAATTTGDVDADEAPDTVTALYHGFGANLEWVTLFAFSADGAQIASSTAYKGDSKIESVSVANGIVSLHLLVVSDADLQNLAHYQQVPKEPRTLEFTVANGAFVPVMASSTEAVPAMPGPKG